MIRRIVVALGMASFTAHAQQVSLDSLYSRDSDDTRVFANAVTAWRFPATAVDTQMMSWYARSDIDVRNSGPGQLRLGFQTDLPAGAATALPNLDLRGAAVKVTVRAASWHDVAQFTVILGSDGAAANDTVTLDVKGALADPRDGEWIDLVVPVHALEKYNAPDLSRINFAMIRARGKAGSHVDLATVSVVRTDATGAMREVRIIDPQFDVGRSTLRNAADAPPFNVGAKVTALDVRNGAADASRRATDGRLLASAEYGRFSAAASLGVLDARSTTTVGSAEIAWRPGDELVLSLGHARNAIDTVEALDADVVQDATTLTADYANARWGVFAAVADIDYSDGNDRTMLNTKIHAAVWERIGASVYVRTLHYRNADPYTGFYFSPEEYDRWLVGVAARTRTGRVLVSGHLDGGQQTTDGDESTGWTTRLSIESKPAQRWTLRVTAGVDQTRPDYRYRYLMGQIAYE